MDLKGQKSSQSSGCGPEEMMMDLRRGPWTVEEDLKLMNYIDTHGEGRWNSLARCAGLKRTGKSCRLRWLNYLRPDVRRGNITLEEQLLILELHSRWGNRWSKIAQHLPGRTDNEIKNYWRTRVQKHAKQLKCDVNSKQFKDTMRYLWMPRLVERIQAAATTTSTSASSSADTHNQPATVQVGGFQKNISQGISTVNNVHGTYTPENSSTAASSDSSAAQVSDITDYNSSVPANSRPDGYGYLQAPAGQVVGNYSQFLIGAPGFSNTGALDYYGQSVDQNYTCWTNGCDGMDQSLYYSDEFWTFLQQQLNS